MSDSTARPTAAEEFDLYTRFDPEGSELALKATDHGVSLTADGVAWNTDARREKATFTDFAAIRLRMGPRVVRARVGEFCQIRLNRGPVLTVFSSNGAGAYEEAQAARYHAFVEQLHQRLSPTQRSVIHFVAGYSPARFMATLIALGLWGLFLFVGIIAAFALGPRQANPVALLMALIVGGVALLAMVKVLQANAPRTYDPSDPIKSVGVGSVGEAIRYVISEYRRTMTPQRWAVLALAATAFFALSVAIVGSRQSANLFEPGRAKHAYESVMKRSSEHAVTKIVVTPKTLTIRFDRTGEETASRASFFGWSEWDRLSWSDRYGVAIEEESLKPFDPEPGDVANFDDLVTAAIARSELGKTSTVTEMVLSEDGCPRGAELCWKVWVSDGGRRTEKVFADRRGTLFPSFGRAAGPPRIVIHVISDTWMRIKNPDGSVRFEGLVTSATNYTVPDIPGMLLDAGEPTRLSISVDGRVVPPLANGSAYLVTAVLDPQSLLDGKAARN